MQVFSNTPCLRIKQTLRLEKLRIRLTIFYPKNFFMDFLWYLILHLSSDFLYILHFLASSFLRDVIHYSLEPKIQHSLMVVITQTFHPWPPFFHFLKNILHIISGLFLEDFLIRERARLKNMKSWPHLFHPLVPKKLYFLDSEPIPIFIQS